MASQAPPRVSGRRSEVEYSLLASKETLEEPTSEPRKRRRPSTGLGALVLFALLIIALVLSPLGNRAIEAADIPTELPHTDSSIGTRPAPVPQCGQAKPAAPLNALDNVWGTLSVKDAVKVRSWLFDKAHGLNLTHGDVANMNDNYVELVEAYYPTKADALNYYAGKGPKPGRSARVVINFGGEKVPTTRNYIVSPLPVSENTTIRLLTEIYHRPIIPHNARTMQPHDSLFKNLPMFGKGLERVTTALYGGVAAGLPNDTLVISGAGPFSFDGSFRRLWLQWKRNVPGDFLNPLDLHQYVDVSGTDQSQWKTVKIVYNHQIFKSKEEFIEAFDNKTLKISGHPEIDNNWAARTRKGPRRDLDHLAGPRTVAFSGLRFRVDRAKQFISWMGWEFYLGFDRDMGLSLWNIKFLGDRIIYELAPQEALAQYSGDDPHQATTAWLDRYFGMGACVYEMIPGYDCPHGAVYLPSTIHGSVGSMTNPRAICVFERDVERPLNRHRGRKPGETGAVKDYVLVVRTVSTVGNYDYFFEYTFMLDGSIETRVSASGYLQGGYWDPTQDQHGTRINKRSMGTLHDHVINFKVDFDIVNEKNSLMEKKTEVRDVSHPWLDEDWGPTTRQQFISQRYIDTEDDSRLFYPANFQGAFAVVNKDELNTWEVPRGYGIHPGFSPIFNTVVGSKRMLNNANFAKQNLAVTVRKETEPSSSSAWNHHLPGAPPVDFDKFFDGESLDQEDIVAWINVGMHHIPQSEDAPNTRTNTATSSFVLSPLNFHDADVSMDSSNAVLLSQDPLTGRWTADENDVKTEHCSPAQPNPLDYGNDILYNLRGELLADDSPEREPWLRESQFPHSTDNWL